MKARLCKAIVMTSTQSTVEATGGSEFRLLLEENRLRRTSVEMGTIEVILVRDDSCFNKVDNSEDGKKWIYSEPKLTRFADPLIQHSCLEAGCNNRAGSGLSPFGKERCGFMQDGNTML